MTTLKTITIVAALLAGGVSLAIAQGPPTGGEPPVAGGAGGNPILNKYGPQGPPPAYTTRHHKRVYMSTRGHKGSQYYRQ
jgi:hypothetical protein